MKTFSNIIRISSLIILLVFTLESFVGYDNGESNPPGTIECIGNAGSDNTFIFRKWAFTKATVPNDDMEQVQVEIDINMSAMETKWKDLEKSVKKKKDYFYVKKFPSAVVSINGATKQGDGSYTTNATLTLKGVTKQIPLSFTVSNTKPYQIKGTGVLNRRDFKFTGDGPKDEVPINFDVTLPN